MAAGDGLISMKPTSITHSGTSASINADGGVDFTAVTSLSLNGVFTSDYDNYLIVMWVSAAADLECRVRLRLSGTDATGTNYVRQALVAAGSTAAASRESGLDYTRINNVDSSERNGDTVHVYGPALAQPTAFRSVTVNADAGARIVDHASTHSLSTAYDGITFFTSTSNMTGTVHVFGYEE